MDDYDDDYDDEGRNWRPWVAGVGAIVVTAIAAAFALGVLPPSADDDGQLATASVPAGSADTVTEPTASENSPRDDSLVDGARVADTTTADDRDAQPASEGGEEDTGATVVSPASTEPEETVADTTPSTEPEDEQADAPPTATEARDDDAPPATEAPSPPPTERDETPLRADPVTTPPPAGAPDQPSYQTLADGSPVPVLAIFDGPLITISGVLPNEAASQRLEVLARANSQVPDAEVAKFVSFDPTVPIGVGVRVIEMNSARFPEGSPDITPEHAAQLDRVVNIMTALPNITTVVIGHADQRGSTETNFALSTQRARTAADYISSRGVDPNRLSSRGAGESDLLSLNDDEQALALNRRTEFVFNGLLVDPAAPEG